MENEEQLALLRRFDCDLAQGFFLGHPVRGEEMLARFAVPLAAAS